MPLTSDTDRLRLRVFTLVSVRVSLMKDRQPRIKGACSAEVRAQVEGATTDRVWSAAGRPIKRGVCYELDHLAI